MEPTDLTIEILKSIRDEIRSTNERLDKTNERLDQSNERLDRLERRQTSADIRLSTQIVALADTMNDIKLLIRDHFGTALRDHEHRITVLEERKSA